MNRVAIFIATGAYSGYSPVAPGTVGTLAAVPLYFLMSKFNPYVYAALLVALFPISLWSAGSAEAVFGAKDSSHIVIDEIIGFLVTMFLAPAGWGALVAGFLLFRFFDIVKVFPAGSLEALGGGMGVVMDDIVAGVYANLTIQLLALTGFFNFFGK